MLLQAPTSFLSALVALASAPPPGPALGNLRLVVATGQGSDPNSAGRPAVTKFDNVNSPPTDAQVAAFINTGARTISSPSGALPALWLEIPMSWVRQLLPGVSLPQQGTLQLDQNCCTDFQGAWGAAFQALGWTAGNPASGPWPIVAG